MNDQPDQETGEHPDSFALAADDAAHKLEERFKSEPDRAKGTWTASDFEVETGSHVTVYRVTLKKKSGAA